MRYIDKYRMHAAAHDINVRFLKDCYADDIHTPLPSPANSKSSYEDLRSQNTEMVLADGRTCCLRNRHLKDIQDVVIVCVGLIRLQAR